MYPGEDLKTPVFRLSLLVLVQVKKAPAGWRFALTGEVPPVYPIERPGRNLRSSPHPFSTQGKHKSKKALAENRRRPFIFNGSPGWTRTNNPAINSRMLHH